MTKRITELSPVISPANKDVFPFVDVSDTAQSAQGSTRKITFKNLADAISVASGDHPYVNTRIITIGHSLVTQQVWQGPLKGYAGLEGYSVQGASGGTVQPKPADPTDGFYSKAFFNDLVSNLTNLNDADDGGNTTTGLTSGVKERTYATIFWAGANDGIIDYSDSSPTLYLDGAQIDTIEPIASGLTQGTFADTSAGISGTSVGEYFDVAGDVSGFSILYEHKSGGTAEAIYHYPDSGTSYTTDRVMTSAEQTEFESRNTTDGSDAFLSEPLSSGFMVTYEALWHTMLANYLDITGFDDRFDHRIFIVREPQAFWKYDGTLDWPEGYYEKNEVHKRVADRWGYPLIDLWANSGINMVSRGWFLQNESSGELFIHVNDKGGRKVGSYVSEFIKQFPIIDYSADQDGSNLGVPTSADDLSPWETD